MQIGKRDELRIGFRAIADRVFIGVAVLQDLLASLAGDPLQESLSFLLMLAGGQNAAARNTDESARILFLEIMERHVLAVFTGLGLIAEPVVMIDDRAFDLAAVYGFHGDTVALV